MQTVRIVVVVVVVRLDVLGLLVGVLRMLWTLRVGCKVDFRTLVVVVSST